MKSPAFQFYAHDFLAGRVATYSLEEIGAYSMLLAFDWSLTGLPVEPEKLARLLRVSRRKFDAIWATIGEQFPEREGRRYNPRLEIERQKQLAWREKSAKGGRAHGTKGGSRVVEPNTQPNGNTPTPSPTPVTDKSKNNGADAPVIVLAARPAKPPRAKRPAAPWMGQLNAVWKAALGGNLPEGSATMLSPVVADIGENETAKRLTAYLADTEAAFATVRGFAAKHGAWSAGRAPPRNATATKPTAADAMSASMKRIFTPSEP